MVTSPRYRALTAPGWTRDPLWTRARMMPSFDIDANFSALPVDRISGQNLTTFTRAASATYVDVDGVIRTAGANTLRRQWDATNQRWGWLVEEARTNSVRNNTMVGAVAGTPGTLPTNWASSFPLDGLTRTIVGTGTSGGVTYVDIRLAGTTSSARTNVGVVFFETNTSVAASSGQTWTQSVYTSVVGGTTSNVSGAGVQVSERAAAGTYLADTTVAFTLSSTVARPSCTRTLSNASTAAVNGALVISYSSGVAIDITLRIGLPQLEQGAFATSVIPTLGSSAATRDADVWTVTGTNFSRWYRQDQGTVFAGYAQVSGGGGRIADIFDGTNSDIPLFVSGSAKASLNVIITGASSGRIDSGTAPSAGTPISAAAAFASADRALCTDGGSVTTSTSPAALPLLNQLRIGYDTVGGSQRNGTISRLTYWPARLSNPVLQELSR